MERRREGLRLARLVGVSDQLRAGVSLVLDPVQAGGQKGSDPQVGVHVSARNPALDPARGAVPDDAEPAGAVVASPGDRGRRPALGGIALVGVDRGRDHQRQLTDPVAHPAQVMAKRVGLLAIAVDEDALAVGVDQARVDMAGASDVLLRGLRHERRRDPAEEGDLLDPVLVDRVPIGRGDRVGVAGVDLVLAVPGLALGELDRNSRRVHAAADRPDVLLVPSRGEDVVVEDVGDGRREVCVVLLVRLGVALLVEVELELGRELGRVAHRGGAFVLGDQDLSR